MLAKLRKVGKSRWGKALFFILAVTFFGGFGLLGNRYRKQQAGQSGAGNVVFEVNGDKVDAREFQKAYTQAKQNWEARMRQMYGQSAADLLDPEKLRADILDRMVRRAILLQESKHLGIKVSETEVKNQIAQFPYFKDQTGRFDPNRYRNALNQAGMTPEGFEQEIMEQVKITRVINTIVAPVQVDDVELKAYFEKVKGQVNISFFAVDPASRYKNLEPTKQEIEDYYKNHISEFDWPEIRKIKYLKFPIADYEKKVFAAEAELKDYYDTARSRYITKPEEAHFRHILIKAAHNAAVEQATKAKEKADKIEEELKAGGDFAGLARKYSDDTQTAAEGGDLGWAPRGSFEAEFEQAGYLLPVGGVSPPVLASDGFHIIKLEGMRPAEYEPLAKVRAEIRKQVVRNKAHILAQEKADLVAKDCKELGIDKAAKKHGVKVFESDWFKKREGFLEGVPDSMDITEQAFYMPQGEVSEVVPGVDDLYLVEVVEIKDPHQATLDEAYSRIKRGLKPELQLKKTRDDGRKWLEQLKKGAGFEGVAQSAGAGAKQTGFFERGAKMVPEIGAADEELQAIVFGLSAKNPVPDDVYETGGKVYVLKLKGEKPADMSKFDLEKDEVGNALLEKKQQEAFDKFIEAKKEGKLIVHQDVYKRIE